MKRWSRRCLYVLAPVMLFLSPDLPTAAQQAETEAEAETETAMTPLPTLEEAVWPPVLPPLRVLIRPESIRRERPDRDAEETGLLLLNGRRASLLDFLKRHREHETDWRPDADFEAASATLRPDLASPAALSALVERADFQLMMGGAMLGMTPAQVYVHYGFLEDGTKARPSGFGAISPIDPVNCPEGGVSCRQSILKN